MFSSLQRTSIFEWNVLYGLQAWSNSYSQSLWCSSRSSSNIDVVNKRKIYSPTRSLRRMQKISSIARWQCNIIRCNGIKGAYWRQKTDGVFTFIVNTKKLLLALPRAGNIQIFELLCQVRWKMNIPRKISDLLPSICQTLLELVDIKCLSSDEKKFEQFFWDTVYSSSGD